ncbi:MAG: hypothetical protein ACYTFY_09920 [Planctomycetota bacterium]|jgi:hypothetical protein
MLHVVCVTGIVAVIAAIIALFWYLEKKRTEAFEELARNMGFEFDKDGFNPNLDSFELFSQGHSRRQKNVMSGSANDIDITIMDYSYTTGSGKSQTTHNQTVIVFESDMLNLTSFTLKPEHFLHKIGSAFGYQDIDFEANPEFSDNYILRGEDEAAVRELFTNDILSYYAGKKGISTEGSSNKLIYFTAGKRPKVEEIQAFLEEGFEAFNLFATRFLTTDGH